MFQRLLLLVLLLVCQAGYAQFTDPNLWITDGNVNAIARQNNTLYIGGTFTYVGPNTGNGAPLSPSTGLVQGTPLSITGGQVLVSISDGNGGFYIGGNFTAVGGEPRAGLAHILSDYTLDPVWAPSNNSSVRCMALSGSTVYLGGDFTSIGGTTRNRIAAVDATTGVLSSWNPNVNDLVLGMTVSGSTVYAVGQFTTVGGLTRNRVCAIDATTGAATSWNPNATGVVFSVIVNGSTVYLGGQFTNMGGQTRNRLAAVDASTGSLLSWNPNANGTVNTMGLSGSTLYVGGSFTTVGGQTRNRLAAVDASSASLLSWNPNAANTVNTIAISGSTLYVGGTFTTVAGLTRNRVAALNLTDGSATSWNPDAYDAVSTITATSSSVYVGSNASTFFIGGVRRNYIAALDVSTGQATSWNPSANDFVNTLAFNGSTIYAGGLFTNIGGQTRNRIAALDASTGSATPWNPNASSSVNTIVVGGSAVYVGGGFSTIGGQTRNRLAALDPSTGSATSWNPNSGSTVNTLLIVGNTLYVGGQFTAMSGSTRNRLASFNLTTNTLTTWNPNANNTVNALEIGGSTIYIGGQFTSVGGNTRNNIAAVDASTGSTTSWNPNANASITGLSISGSTLYLAGTFTTLSGQTRNRLAAVEVSTGNITSWNPNANNFVSTTLISGTTLYAGGAFTTINGRSSRSIASLEIPNSCPTATVPTITTSGPTTFCSGGSVTLTAPSSSRYIWSTGAISQSITVNSSGTYTLQVVADGCTSAVASTVVTVNSPNEVPSIAGTNTICPSTTTTLTFSGVTGTYELSSNGGSSWNAVVGTTATVGVGTYVVRGIVSGCPTASSSPFVITETNPTISVTNDVCGSVTLTASGPGVYTWSTGATGSSITVTETGVYTVGNVGCSTSRFVRVQKPVSISLSPTAGFCPGQNVTLTTGLSTGQVNFLAGAAGVTGLVNGTGTNSRFNSPTAITVGPDGHYYVTDYSNNCIRRINRTTGESSIFAGSTTGVAGLTNGTGTAGRFNLPVDLAVDSRGNIIVTDAGNNCIRRITPAGVVTTIAGSGTAGSANGNGAAASFTRPYGIAIDAQDNLYITEEQERRIRRITPAGDVTTISVALPAGTAMWGIETNAAGTLYHVACGDNTVKAITNTGSFSTYAGISGTSGSTNGSLSVATFNSIRGMSRDRLGNLYVADINANLIRRITPSGVTTVAGTGTNASTSGSIATAAISLPHDVLVDDDGNLVLVEFVGHTVKTVTVPSNPTWTNGLTGVAPTVNTAGTYTVSTTNFHGCIATATSVLTQFTATVPTITGTNTICEGGSTTLTATAGLNSYQWSSDGGSTWTTASASNTINVSPTGTTNYRVRSVSAQGCNSAASAAYAVTVNLRPTGHSITGAGTICNGGSIILTGTAGHSFYQWSSDNGTTWTTNNASNSLTISPTANTNYVLRVVSAQGCTSLASAAVTVTVNQPLAVPTISGTNTICEGGSTTLTATAGLNSYQWSSDGGSTWTTASASNTINVSPSGTTNYRVRSVSAQGCNSAASAAYAVTVNLRPNPGIVASSTQICGTGSVVLTGSGGTTYSWSPATGLSATTGAVVTASPTTTTTYTLTARFVNGCEATSTVTINVRTRPAAPNVNFINGGEACAGSLITVTNTADCPSCTYTWAGGGTGVTTPVLVGTNSYTVTATDAFGCTNTSSTSISLTGLTAGTWLGNSDSWTSASNWCGGVPVSGADISIRSGSMASPRVPAGTVLINNLTLGSGVTLNMDASSWLNITGNISGGGSINGGCQGSIQLMGSGQQQLINVPVSLNQLTINNASGVKLNNLASICGALNLTNGNVNSTDGTLILTPTAINITETAASRVIGTITARGRMVGTGTLNMLGVQLAAGADDLDTVFVQRRSEITSFLTRSGIGATWSIRAHRQPTSGRQVTLYWPASKNNNRSHARMQVWRRPDNSTSWLKVGGLQNRSSVAASPFITVNTTGFSDWTVSDEANTLPVTWQVFTAQRKTAEQVTLKWTTAQEIQNAGFRVERSTDNITFDSVGWVAGNGTTIAQQHYTFTDLHSGQAYYRLTQVDHDGTQNRSHTIYVDEWNTNAFQVYPNPTSGDITLGGIAAGTVIEVVSSTGKTVLTTTTTTDKLDLGQMPAGVYFIQVGSQRVKVVKQ